jgi:hypothetical protein
MGERRFFIRELEMPQDSYGLESITESELQRRLVTIATYMHSEEGMWPRGIQTLLHGEAKEPPTDAWEAWVQRMPLHDDVLSLAQWDRLMKQWFREMPR